jgi:hypothetical protein
MSEQLHFDFARPAQPVAEPKVLSRAELPRDAGERGYHVFISEQAAALRDLEQRFGLILNRRVRVALTGIPAEFEGKLLRAQLLPPASRSERLRLRIGSVEFDDADIERCVRLD